MGAKQTRPDVVAPSQLAAPENHHCPEVADELRSGTAEAAFLPPKKLLYNIRPKPSMVV